MVRGEKQSFNFATIYLYGPEGFGRLTGGEVKAVDTPTGLIEKLIIREKHRGTRKGAFELESGDNLTRWAEANHMVEDRLVTPDNVSNHEDCAAAFGNDRVRNR